jgi:hypothetical protein
MIIKCALDIYGADWGIIVNNWVFEKDKWVPTTTVAANT